MLLAMTAIKNRSISEQSFVVNSYDIQITNDNMSNRTGYTFGNGTIYIKADRTVAEIYLTCNHEMLHNVLKYKDLDAEEQIVRQIENVTHFAECAKILVLP